MGRRRPNGPTAALVLATALVATTTPGPATAGEPDVRGRVFADLNLNGVGDAGESGVAGATVRATDASGTAVAATATGPDGSYVLRTPGPREVRIQIDAPAGFTAGPHHGDAGTTVEFVPAGAQGVDLALLDGRAQAQTSVMEIGDRVWRDVDGDGLQDAGEPPIPGVTVSLWGPSGRLATAVTDANGRFFFSSLPAPAGQPASRSDIYGVARLGPGAAYSLRLDNPVDYASGPLRRLTLTLRAVGPDRSVDSDGAIVDMFARSTFMAGSGSACDATRDFGFIRLPHRR